MKKLLRSRQARLIGLLTLILACLLAWSGSTTSNSGPAQQVFGVLLTPFQKIAAVCGGGVGDFFQNQLHAGELARQNEELIQENEALRARLAGYDALKAENEGYRAREQRQQEEPGAVYLAASVIGRDPLAAFGAFTADKGTAQGVSVGLPVTSQSGCLVGRVAQVTLTECTVMTLLDPDFGAACLAGASRENGILTGSADSEPGLTTLTGLPRESVAAPNDLVSTSGLGGVFPAGLLVGSITQLAPDASGKTLVAQVKPAVDPNRLTGVLIRLKDEG